MFHSDRELLLAYSRRPSTDKLAENCTNFSAVEYLMTQEFFFLLEVQLTHGQTATTYFAVRCGNKTKTESELPQNQKRSL